MQKVWFQLVDVDGNDLSSAFYVKIENDEDIVGFLKDVKKDYTNKLTHVDAGDLIVYANRATFNTDALIVVVPMQAQQNMERDAKKQKVEETPDIWMKVLADERVDILPLDREALQLHLERELREKIPIAEKDAMWVSSLDTKGLCTTTFKKLFVEQNHVTSPPTTRIVWSTLYPRTSGSENATEDTYHSFWDDHIANVLREVSSGTFRRNSNESTSTGLCRPNLCFYYAKKNVCVFRGEEKACGNMGVPLHELCAKLIWRYDNAPYVFGYAAVGFEVCLVTIRKDSNTAKPRSAKVEVIEQFDLSELNGRFSFLLALLNLSTLFRSVVDLIQQPFSVPEYSVIVRANGVKISFAEDSVKKEYPSDMPSNTIINNLKTLHSQMKTHSVPNVVVLKSSDLKKKHVVLAPVGLIAPPTDVKQLVTALHDILTALVALHKLGLMHRDLRWENVLKYQHDRNEWFLIDFDDGASAPAKQGALHLDPKSHAPEIASLHSVKVDIWSVGYLLRTATVSNFPPQLEAIQEQCLQQNPTKRPSAASLLKALQKIVVMESTISESWR